MNGDEKLVADFRNGNKQALVDLLNSAEPVFLHFVKVIRETFKSRGWELSEDDIEDALSAAKLEYIKLIYRFDVESGIKLKTYAWNRVMYCMWETILENRSIIHIPKEKRKLCFEYIEMVDNTEVNTDDEICEVMNITKDTIKIIRELLSIFKMCSADYEQDYVIYKMDTNGQMSDFSIDVERQIDLDCFYDLALSEKILKPIEIVILKEYYSNDKSIAEISREQGLDEKDAYNHKARALNKIRRNHQLIRKYRNYMNLVNK